ncbi:MAG: 3-oxoacyl-ACP reductase family protein [Candidatus Uhrbacteria bacterium]|nr:3-oxoacyl-ACP reductase family protein [Candidatus Uhrbacteria bacterium]
MRLENKIAIITGASRGIGRVAAILLAKEGAKVVVVYRSSQQDAVSVVEEIKKNGSEGLAIKCDVSKAEEVDAMIQEVLAAFGRIDILVNNAGILVPKSFDEMTDEIWDRTIDTNLRGSYNCIKAVSRQMKKQKYGKIVNVSSISAIVGSLTSASYSVSKAGIDALTKTLAAEFGKFNITINSVAPGPVHTDLLHEIYSKELIDKLAGETPMGRIATPEDIAKVILFFSSDDSDFVNGQTLIVDGGRIIR